ncbi:RmlC-like cupin domain-containing protein [Podospora australis]|uniref:RmlC-like cupin domain-containing protein n=1 Tax=Podospora australis TaxID=1536484 RepID=A0AAN7AK33_9PEZI|nr:RmlC-like cupin domain-containing protein [Podospora australis]
MVCLPLFPLLQSRNTDIRDDTACGMAALHIHPRATEIFLVVKGRVLTETVLETGVTAQDSDPTNPLKPRLIKNELTENQATVFPQGSFHTQMNPECTPGYAIAAFSSEDPGAALAAPQTFALTDDFVIANFGGAVDEAEIQRIRDGIPKGALAEVEACKKRCGL